MRKQFLLWKHWLGMISGRSYWHLPQPLGRAFIPGELHGYYNDLIRKTTFPGPTDNEGIPLVTSPACDRFYHPITIAHKALGHWDSILVNEGDLPHHRRELAKLAHKLLAMQDARGGWPLAEVLGVDFASPYSAMAQGEAASLFVRVWKITGDHRFLEAAERALTLMLQPVGSGGTTRDSGADLILEEYCWTHPNTILNGWIYGLYGLHDYLIVRDHRAFRTALDRSVGALVRWLPRFDAGYWSLYDTRRNVASPFYHTLHIAQLEALELTFPSHRQAISVHREKYQRYAASRLRLWRAFASKAWQKLSSPPETVTG